MLGLEIDLNEQPPESGDLYPIDWDDIVEYDGPAHQLEIMTWFGMMEAKVQIYQYLYFAFCYFCLWIYSFFLCVATFGEQGDEGDAETGVQLPEADCLQGASTKGVMLQV